MSALFATISLVSLILLVCLPGTQGYDEACVVGCNVGAGVVNGMLEGMFKKKLPKENVVCIIAEKAYPCYKKCGMQEKDMEDDKKKIRYSQNCVPHACENKAVAQLVTDLLAAGLSEEISDEEKQKGCPSLKTLVDSIAKCNEISDKDKKNWKDLYADSCNKESEEDRGNNDQGAIIHTRDPSTSDGDVSVDQFGPGELYVNVNL